jgi:LmbE family N-acetylglucosaminyl deacetylase
MLTLGFQKKDDSALRFLFLGAHCDDIEIGAGGTVLGLAERHPEAHFHWVVFASNPGRAKEAEASAEAFLGDVANRHIEINSFRESFFPYIGADIKAHFENIKQRVNPDVIFTHYRDDRHQDHRVISDLTWNTYRDHFILEYEIPKYDGDLGRPNVFSALATRHLEKKIELLLTHFESQADRSWFDAETFRAILRIRGVECNAPERHAEAFFCRKGMI